MASILYEAQIVLACQALKQDPELSVRKAADLYSVNRTTLSRRQRGKASRRDHGRKSRKLTELEESTIVQYIIDLDSRSFPPRLIEVEDMANRLLADRDAPRVGTRWATNFIKRQPDLRTRSFRRLDY